MRSFSWCPLLLFLIPAAILQKQSRNTLSSALCSSSYLRRRKGEGQFSIKCRRLWSFWLWCAQRRVTLTCRSCSKVWSALPGSSSSPARQRTGRGWCAADPAAHWGWTARTGCWSGPAAWPADLCRRSAAGCPKKKQMSWRYGIEGKKTTKKTRWWQHVKF